MFPAHHGDSVLMDRFKNYLAHADDGTGHELGTGEPLKSFDEWLNT
jgi:hypothetical protein